MKRLNTLSVISPDPIDKETCYNQFLIVSKGTFVEPIYTVSLRNESHHDTLIPIHLHLLQDPQLHISRHHIRERRK